MLCPQRKRIIYNCGRNSGQGYPLEWIAQEEFEDCIGNKCIAFLNKGNMCKCKLIDSNWREI